jgi:glycosyltransferase involved in cell wall biosynthesis
MSNKVSTITPCFKGERYLEKFLNELPKQTCFDKIEIVLDHNEPTEAELALVANFNAKYPGRLKHIVVNPVDPIGISMNRCIKEASGEYVTIWNIDDLRTPDSIQKQIDFLDSHHNHDVVHGNFVIVNQFGSTHGQYIDHTWTLDRPEELVRGMMLGPFFMWRKSLCDKAGYFDEQLKTGADFDLAIRLAMHSKVGMTHGVLGYYLDEGRGASTNGSAKQPVERTVIETRYAILDKIEKQWTLHPLFKDYDPQIIVNFGQKIPIERFSNKHESHSPTPVQE